jgi:hypothetical protein
MPNLLLSLFFLILWDIEAPGLFAVVEGRHLFLIMSMLPRLAVGLSRTVKTQSPATQ